MPARTLFFGLDACEPRTARKLAADGRMPTLARLLDTASQVETQGPPVGTYVSALWPTLWTARRPTRHGYTCWFEVDRDTYAYRQTTPRGVRGKPFWVALSDAGRRVAIVDAPHSFVDEPVNGLILAEWAAHDRHFGTASWPPQLERDMVERFGRHPVAGYEHDRARQFAPCDWVLGGPWGVREHDAARTLRDDLVAGVEHKERVSLELLAREDWDLFFTVIGETHCVGHQFWFLHDREHEAHDPELAAELGDPVATIYERADQVLGRHLDAVGRGSNVLVFLSHGMGAHYNGTHLLEPVLRRLGDHWRHGYRGRAPVTMAKRAWERVPSDVRHRLHGAMGSVVRRHLRHVPASPDAGPVSPADAPFYLYPNNEPVGAVRLNVIGRERAGIVAVGDYEAVRAQLATDLLELTNVASGEPAVDRVVTAESVFPDRDPLEMADLYVVWNYRSQIECVYSPKIGALKVPYNHVRTGDHRPEGLVLATGPRIAPLVARERVGVEHVAPTVAALLDVDLRDVDGVPIASLLREPAVA